MLKFSFKLEHPLKPIHEGRFNSKVTAWGLMCEKWLNNAFSLDQLLVLEENNEFTRAQTLIVYMKTVSTSLEIAD